MAYLTGLKHQLFMREETTYGKVQETDLTAANQEWISGFNVYTRPGGRITAQSNPVVQPGLGAPSAIGRSRIGVSGSFSFYLEEITYKGQNTATTPQGFLLLFKHLYGEVTSSGSGGTNPDPIVVGDFFHQTATGSNAVENKLHAHFSKFDTVKDHAEDNTSADGLNYPSAAANKKGSFSFLSYFDENEVYLYSGVCPTSMTINVGDANSLVTVDVSFIARSIDRLYYTTSGADTTGVFRNLGPSNFWDSDDTTGKSTDAAIITNAATIFFPTGGPRKITPNFTGMDLSMSLTLGDQAFTTGTDGFLQTSGVSINISRPMGYTGGFGSYSNAFSLKNLWRNDRPVLTSSKSITGSFTVPVLKHTINASGSGNTSEGYDSYMERLREVSLGRNTLDSPLEIKFDPSTATRNSYTFNFDNIIFGATDFDNISTNIMTTTVNWTAVPSKTEALNEDRMAEMTYTENIPA